MLISPLYKFLAIAALVLGLAAAVSVAVHHYGDGRYETGKAEVQAKWNAAIVKQQAQAIADSQSNARETLRRMERQQEAQRAFNQQLATARRDAASADRSAVKLRDQLALYVTAVKRGSGSNTAAVPVSPATGTALDLLADMQRRIDEAAGGIADFADRSRAAGLQCETEHDALTTRK